MQFDLIFCGKLSDPSSLRTPTVLAPAPDGISSAAMSYFDGRRMMVTCEGGFLGRAVVRTLEKRGAREIFVPRSRDCDLRERETVV